MTWQEKWHGHIEGAKAFVQVDLTKVPEVKFVFQPKGPTAAEFNHFLELFCLVITNVATNDDLESNHGRVVLLFDCRNGRMLNPLPLSKLVKILKKEEWRQRFMTRLCCSAVVVDSDILRILLDTVLNRVEFTRPTARFETKEAARAYFVRELAKPPQYSPKNTK